MPRAPVLRNTCHGPRTSIPQRAGCLPPHTDRVQQDIHPPDSPAPSTQESENAMWDTTSRPTTRKKPARAQLCHRRCAGQPAPRRWPGPAPHTGTEFSFEVDNLNEVMKTMSARTYRGAFAFRHLVPSFRPLETTIFIEQLLNLRSKPLGDHIRSFHPHDVPSQHCLADA